MFCGVGARKGQESEGNGFLGFLYCSGAREERAAGAVRGCPRRRRGGGRRGGSGSGGARGTAEELQREATGGGGGAVRRVGASARRSNGRESFPPAPAVALSVGGGENRAGRWEMEIRAILQLPKIPRTKL